MGARRFLLATRKTIASRLKKARCHPRWDEASRRIRLTAEEIARLPVEIVRRHRLEEIMDEIEFNPIAEYPQGVGLLLDPSDESLREFGHDLVARYLATIDYCQCWLVEEGDTVLDGRCTACGLRVEG